MTGPFVRRFSARLVGVRHARLRVGCESRIVAWPPVRSCRPTGYSRLSSPGRVARRPVRERYRRRPPRGWRGCRIARRFVAPLASPHTREGRAPPRVPPRPATARSVHMLAVSSPLCRSEGRSSPSGGRRRRGRFVTTPRRSLGHVRRRPGVGVLRRYYGGVRRVVPALFSRFGVGDRREWGRHFFL